MLWQIKKVSRDLLHVHMILATSLSITLSKYWWHQVSYEAGMRKERLMSLAFHTARTIYISLSLHLSLHTKNSQPLKTKPSSVLRNYQLKSLLQTKQSTTKKPQTCLIKTPLLSSPPSTPSPAQSNQPTAPSPAPIATKPPATPNKTKPNSNPTPRTPPSKSPASQPPRQASPKTIPVAKKAPGTKQSEQPKKPLGTYSVPKD